MTEDNRSNQRIDQRRASRHPLAFDIQIRSKGRRHLPATLTSIFKFGCSVVGAALSKSDDLVWVRYPDWKAKQRSCAGPTKRGLASHSSIRCMSLWRIASESAMQSLSVPALSSPAKSAHLDAHLTRLVLPTLSMLVMNFRSPGVSSKLM